MGYRDRLVRNVRKDQGVEAKWGAQKITNLNMPVATAKGYDTCSKSISKRRRLSITVLLCDC